MFAFFIKFSIPQSFSYRNGATQASTKHKIKLCRLLLNIHVRKTLWRHSKFVALLIRIMLIFATGVKIYKNVMKVLVFYFILQIHIYSISMWERNYVMPKHFRSLPVERRKKKREPDYDVSINCWISKLGQEIKGTHTKISPVRISKLCQHLA